MATWSYHMIWLYILAMLNKDVYCFCRWHHFTKYNISYDHGHRNVTCGIDPGKFYQVTMELVSDTGIIKYENACYMISKIENRQNASIKKDFLGTWLLDLSNCSSETEKRWMKEKYGTMRMCYYLQKTPKKISYKIHYKQDAYSSRSGKVLKATLNDEDTPNKTIQKIQLPIIIQPLSFSYQILEAHEKSDNRIKVDKEIIHLASLADLENKRLVFCIKNLPQGLNKLELIQSRGYPLTLKNKTETLSDNYDFYEVCSSVDIILTQQTVYLFIASETHTTCTRSANWTVIFSTCEADKIKEVGNGNQYITFLGEKNSQPRDDCFLLNGMERWRAHFTAVVTDGCSSKILIHTIHPSDHNDKRLISQIDIEECKQGRVGKCKYKNLRQAVFGNIAEYEITIIKIATQNLSLNNISVTIPRSDKAPGVGNWTKNLGTLRVITKGFIATNYEITEFSQEKLCKSSTFVHFEDDGSRKLMLCVTNIMTPFELSLDNISGLDKQIINNRVCVQKAIDTANRTVHEFSYRETDNCRREESFTLFLTSCRNVRYQNKSSLQYDRLITPDRCLRIEGKDFWSVSFSVEIPDDCFKRKIILSAPSWPGKEDQGAVEVKVFNLNKCVKEGRNAECIFIDGGPAKRNIKTYQIGFTYPAYLNHSGRELKFSMHGKDKSVPHYTDSLGYLDITARKVQLSFMISTIHNNLVDLVEDEEIKVFAWTRNQGIVLFKFCAKNLMGNITLSIDKHKAQLTKADNNCFYKNLQLSLGRMTLNYRENNNPCSDRHGVTYLHIEERPSHLTTKKPDITRPDNRDQPVASAPKKFTVEEIIRFLSLVALGAIIILALIYYIAYWRKKDRQQSTELEESATTEMTESEIFSIISASEVGNPNRSEFSKGTQGNAGQSASIFDIASSYLFSSRHGGESSAIHSQQNEGASSKIASLSAYFLGSQPTSKNRGSDSSF